MRTIPDPDAKPAPLGPAKKKEEDSTPVEIKPGIYRDKEGKLQTGFPLPPAQPVVYIP